MGFSCWCLIITKRKYIVTRMQGIALSYSVQEYSFCKVFSLVTLGHIFTLPNLAMSLSMPFLKWKLVHFYVSKISLQFIT